MQRVTQRVRIAERILQKKKKKVYEQKKRSEGWERNQTRQRLVRANTEALRADRKNRHLDWEAGPLAPRRDVGEMEKLYGAVSYYNLTLPERDPDYRPKEKFIFAGDRVVVIRGREKGKIGVVEKADYKMVAVEVKGLNTVDVHVPSWMKQEANDDRDLFTVDQMIPMDDVRLVYPLPDPETGVLRDVIIEELVAGPGSERQSTRGKSGKGRMIAGTTTFIPMPKGEGRSEPILHEDDTELQHVNRNTFRPFLIRPPMPLSVIDELRDKYSRFRTRHEYDYIMKKEAEEAKLEGRKDLIKTMRTPLQELAAIREKKKKEQEQDLTMEQLSIIGDVIAQEQARTGSASQALEA